MIQKFLFVQTFRCPPRVDDVDRCGAGGGGDDPHGLHQDSQGVSNVSHWQSGNSIKYFQFKIFGHFSQAGFQQIEKL